jgi:hypothetical protein
MSSIAHRVTKLENRSHGAQLAEAGLLAIERFRAGTATDADLVLISRPGALAAVSDEELKALIDETRLSLMGREPQCLA